MEKNIGQCSECRFCDRYFVKGIKEFKKINFGWCSQRRSTVEIHENCQKFERNVKKVKSKKLLRCYLSDILTEISEIRMIIKEENDV